MLPAGFVPSEVLVTLRPKSGDDIVRKLDWREARAGRDAQAVP